MIKNRKRKGFTIVELVIVIAIIAILAAVLIPTFASIIARANESADIQAVRQMNIALMAESVENPPKEIKDVIRILKNAGYNATDKLVPVSAGHGFYWCKSANLIALIKDADTNSLDLIFPLDNETLTNAFNNSKAGGLTTDEGFYDLEPSGETYLPEIEKENNNGGESIVEIEANTSNLIDLLQKGGNFKLTSDLKIDQPITLSNDTTIDLKGFTLTIGAAASLTINGNVKFTNGSIIIDNILTEEIMEKYYAEEISFYELAELSSLRGIDVKGTLELDTINITGERDNNIINDGNISLTSTNLLLEGIKSKTVREGTYGLVNNGTATILSTSDNRNTFVVADSDYALPISNSGIMTIENTDFSEKDGMGGYMNAYAPIKVAAGEVTLTNVTVDSSTSIINVSADTKATISGGTFTGTLELASEAIINIDGAKFTNGTASVRFGADGCYYYAGPDAEGQLISVDLSGDLLGDLLNAINQIITANYAEYHNEDTDHALSIIATNNTTTKKTTYAIVDKPYISAGDPLFGNDLIVNDDEVVTMYLNTDGFYVSEDILVMGTLNVVTGKINTVFTGKTFEDGVAGKIVVKHGATLKLNATHYYRELEGGTNGNNYNDRELFKDYTVTELSEGATITVSANVIKSYVVGILNGSISATSATLKDASENTTTVSTTDGVVTITLGSNLTLSNVSVSGNNKIALNGKTLTIGSGFAIADGSTLTIEGGGTFVYGENTINVEAGKTYNVTIVDGTVTATPTT